MAFSMLLISLLIKAAHASAGSQETIVDEAFPVASPCEILDRTFSGQVVYPQPERSEPVSSCRFLPSDARDIQEALADVLIPHNVSIAITSGGDPSSVVDGGITVDLSQRSQIHLSDDHRTVAIGPGAKWADVYSELEPWNLTVSGSRSSHDRVGSSILGGDISWFSNEHGWTCDGVLEFEVVTPLGRRLWINTDSDEGLFWALKGSHGALGIVTKITLPTIRSEAIYGGALTFEDEHFPRVFQAIEYLTLSARDEIANTGYLSLTWHAFAKSFSYSTYIVNTANNRISPALAAFRAIPHPTSSLRQMTIAESAEEVTDITNLAGTRRTRFTLTVRLDTEAMPSLHDAVLASARDMDLHSNETYRVTFQPLTIPHLLASSQNNVFNLDPARGPLLLIIVEMAWTEPTRDTHFDRKAKTMRKSLERKMESMHVLEEFIHPLYAAKDQNPFARERWKMSPQGKMVTAVARKYDPDGVWKKMVPGIWHV